MHKNGSKNLEQEQYLEELGRKLNRSHDEELSEDISREEDSFILEQTSLAENFEEKSISVPSFSKNPKPLRPWQQQATELNLKKHLLQESPSKLRLTPKNLLNQKKLEPIPVNGLEETAAKLGVEPEFLVEKGTKALLRMIARNGGQLRFPLEIDQID